MLLMNGKRGLSTFRIFYMLGTIGVLAIFWLLGFLGIGILGI